LTENNKAIVVGLGLVGSIALKALKEENYYIVGIDIEDNKSDILNEFYECDVTKEEDVKAVFKDIFKSNPDTRVLINSIGEDVKYNKDGKGFEVLNKQTSKEFDDALTQGLTTYFNTSKYFVDSLLQQDNEGLILNVASDLSVIAPDHRIYNKDEIKKYKPAHYSSVKHGVVGLTKYFASTFAPLIRANSLSPSGIYLEHYEADFVEKISNTIPMQRMLNPEELIESIKFLCNKKNSFLNGHNLVVDGGRTIW
tara:strand:+ start:904 stop:1662 length:759 start_codon:yes stop_codon:yes gene_type:complete